jgi:hypothetical protein
MAHKNKRRQHQHQIRGKKHVPSSPFAFLHPDPHFINVGIPHWQNGAECITMALYNRRA